MGVTTETQKANREYVSGKISSWEHYVRVSREIAKRLEKRNAGAARRNGRWKIPLLRR